LRAAAEELTRTSHKLAEAIYAKASQQAGAGPAAGASDTAGAAGATGGKDDAVDADFEEVKG